MVGVRVVMKKKRISQLTNHHVALAAEALVGVALAHVQRPTKFQKFKKSTFWSVQKLAPLQNSQMTFIITSKHSILR